MEKPNDVVVTPSTRHPHLRDDRSSSNAQPASKTIARANLTSDLTVVSAFGRGDWLAAELAGRGWKVTLIDVSAQLGGWTPEDAEGPFGFFDSPDLTPSQKSMFQAGSSQHHQGGEETGAFSVRSGFTVWMNDGPLECRSELTGFHLKKKGFPKLVETYLRRVPNAAREAAAERRALAKLPYRANWLAQLAHQIASPVWNENQSAIASGKALPIFSAFSVRRPSTATWKSGLNACQAVGVQIKTGAVSDLRLGHGRSIESVQFADGSEEGGRTFVWTLSAAESANLSAGLGTKLFPKGIATPSWFWARYSVEFGNSESSAPSIAGQLPRHVAMISDAYLPWTHANLLIVRRRDSATDAAADVWTRIPAWTRFNKKYLQEMAMEIEGALRARLPFTDGIRVTGLPAEASADESELGPPRFPVFAGESLRKQRALRSPNFFFSSPEQCDFLDWLGMYRRQNEIVLQLEKLKTQWVAAADRQAAKEAKRMARAAAKNLHAVSGRRRR